MAAGLKFLDCKGFPHSRPGFLWLGFGPPLGFSGPMESIEPGNQRADRFSPREWINRSDRRSSRSRLIVLRLSDGNSAIKSSIARPADACNRMESSNRALFRAQHRPCSERLAIGSGWLRSAYETGPACRGRFDPEPPSQVAGAHAVATLPVVSCPLQSDPESENRAGQASPTFLHRRAP